MTGKHVVFDGHCMVKDGARIVVIPLSVVKRLCPDRIIFFDVTPEEIVERRLADRSRPNREVETAAELTTIRRQQIELSRQFAVDLNITFAIACNDAQLREELGGIDGSNMA